MGVPGRISQLEVQLERSPAIRYAAAIIAALLGLLARYMTYVLLGVTPRLFSLSYLGIILIALQTTSDAALLTLVVSILGSILLGIWFEGVEAVLSVKFISQQAIHIFVSMVIIWMANEQRKARIRAEYRRGAIENVAEQLQRLKRDYEQTIRQLDRESAYLEAVLRQMPSGVIIASPTGETLSMNRRAEVILGQGRPSLKEARENNPYRMFKLDDDSVPLAIDDYPLARALRGETVHDLELKIELGADVWRLRLSSAPIYNLKGELIAAVIMLDDLTRELALREELQRSLAGADVERRRLQTVLDVLPVGVTIADAKGELVYMNDGALRIWGESAPMVSNAAEYSMYKAWYAESQMPVRAEDWAMARALASGDVTRGEVLEIERFDGRRAMMINAACPIRDEQGQIIGGVAINMDVNQLHLTQKALAAEETRSRQITQFVSAFSHDFKTPLSIINTSSYLLARTLAGEQEQARVVTIQEQTERLAKMIDDLITLVKLDRVNEIRFAPLDLGEIVETTMEFRRTQADNKHISLQVTVPDEPVTIMGEPDYLKRAIGELVDNALRFTRAQGAISVRVTQHEGQANLTIADTGVGVEPDALARIFHAMYRADAARNPDSGGLGLGLTIVRQIIEQHLGKIEVTSELGNGTTFCITLPLVE